jgi:hypothetical protein
MMRKVMIVLYSVTSITMWAYNDEIPPSSDKIYGNTVYRYIPRNTESVTDTSLGDVIFELDVETPTGDNQLLGVEFDGTYFYVTGGAGGSDPNKVYVIDTLGNVIFALDQPAHLTNYWGWRDLAWDGVYVGPDRIDTLYGSFGRHVHKFGVNFEDSTLDHYDPFYGPLYVNRALAYMEDSAWFFTGDGRDSCYKFSKTNTYIDFVSNYYYIYGAAYDSDVQEGGYVWWHSQDNLGSPFYCVIEQMDAMSMNFTGVFFDIVPTTINSGIAGGLCFYEGFRGMDVLFALIQGNPVDMIAGIFIRYHVPGIAEEPSVRNIEAAGFTSCVPNPTRRGTTISFSLVTASEVFLEIYNKIGRRVRTLVDGKVRSGTQTVYWDGNDDDGRSLPVGVYFARFETEGCKETEKLILLR